jgi:hypothetical protein
MRAAQGETRHRRNTGLGDPAPEPPISLAQAAGGVKYPRNKNAFRPAAAPPAI